LDAVWPSQNTLGGNLKGDAGFRYRRAKARLRKALEHAADPTVTTADDRRRVVFTRFYGRRRRPYDYANLVGGGKPLVDLLVESGYLVNDTESLFEGIYHQKRSPDGTDSIRIEFYDFLGEVDVGDMEDYTTELEGEGMPAEDSGGEYLAVEPYEDPHDRVFLCSAEGRTLRAARVELQAKAMAAGMIRIGEVVRSGKYYALRARNPAKMENIR